MGNVWARLGDFSPMFNKEMAMIIAVEETVVAFLAVSQFDGLEGALLKDDNQAFGRGTLEGSLGDLGGLLRLQVFHII